MLTVGLIGFGGMGRKYLKLLAARADVQVKALCVHSQASLTRLQNEFGARYDLYTDYRRLLEDAEISTVLVLTPHPTHFAIAKHALEKGRDVLVEKPVTLTGAEATTLNEMATSRGLIFSVCYDQRFMPSYQKVKALVDSGTLGTLQRSSFEVTTMYRPQAYYDSAAWRGTLAGEGGGVLLNQANHHLDLYLWLCGRPQKATALLRTAVRRDIEVEEAAQVTLKFSPAHFGTLTTSVTEPYPVDTLTLVFTGGKIIAGPTKVQVIYNDQEISHGVAPTPPVTRTEIFNYANGKPESYALLIADFLEACRTRRAPLVTGASAARTTTCLEKIYQAGQTQTWVTL